MRSILTLFCPEASRSVQKCIFTLAATQNGIPATVNYLFPRYRDDSLPDIVVRILCDLHPDAIIASIKLARVEYKTVLKELAHQHPFPTCNTRGRLWLVSSNTALKRRCRNCYVIPTAFTYTQHFVLWHVALQKFGLMKCNWEVILFQLLERISESIWKIKSIIKLEIKLGIIFRIEIQLIRDYIWNQNVIAKRINLECEKCCKVIKFGKQIYLEPKSNQKGSTCGKGIHLQLE